MKDDFCFNKNNFLSKTYQLELLILLKFAHFTKTKNEVLLVKTSNFFISIFSYCFKGYFQNLSWHIIPSRQLCGLDRTKSRRFFPDSEYYTVLPDIDNKKIVDKLSKEEIREILMNLIESINFDLEDEEDQDQLKNRA